MRIEPQVSLPIPTAAKFARDGRAGAAAGAARIAVERVRVAGLAEQRAQRRDAAGELVHVRLGDDDRPGVAELLDEDGVGSRDPSRQRA